jgi:ribose 5-phosphate isomerase A
MSRELKIKAAEAAFTFVEEGMKLGIGTGSTADEFIRILAAHVAKGMNIIGVPTSERSKALCEELGVPLTTLEETPELDLTIDGADEIDGDMVLIKGGGGALLREKIVAAASQKMVVIADVGKMVKTLGAFPLPIEVNSFGLGATRIAVAKVAKSLGLSGDITLRGGDDKPFVTDGGHYILDASFGRIQDAKALSSALLEVPGVVQHGLFINLATACVIAGPGGVEVITR